MSASGSTIMWFLAPHEGTNFELVSFVAFLTGVFFMCGCMATDNPPYCFGNCTGHAQRYKKVNLKFF